MAKKIQFISLIQRNNNRGGFCCRFPGTKPCKIGYSDKYHDTSNLYEGWARVTITNERPHEFFFTAEMLEDTRPSDDALVDYLLSKPKMDGVNEAYVWGATLTVQRTHFEIRWGTGRDMRGFSLVNVNGKIQVVELFFNRADGMAASNYIFQHLFGYTEAELYQMYTPFEYHTSQAQHSDRWVNDVFADALDSELIEVREIHGIKFVEFLNFTDVAVLFNREEMLDIIKQASLINQEANTAIKRKLQKGFIKARPIHLWGKVKYTLDDRRVHFDPAPKIVGTFC